MSGRRSDGPVPSDTLAALDRARDQPGPHLWVVPAPPPTGDADEVLRELDALLARGELDEPAVARLVALAPRAPGRLRAVVGALAAAGGPAAVAGLLTLPQVPGALEAVARALARGLTRALPGSAAAPVFFALDFRGSRARPFPDLLRRAQLVAADPSGALRLDVLRVDGKPAYRLSFWPDTLPARARAGLARACAADLALLHGRLARLRGTRLWLNGFCFADDGPVSVAAQGHLLAAWLTWSEGHAP
ncbi:hypothetical protein SAMN02745121_07798 [Nannocystis exedens]|uniref:Uncharacterized protein n=1 Tax=Nannocystis exedens TaxID=54 RepID=A0A1I2HBT3_9BACT|nr:hypothetical protein [Nannocystis exedens]PCC75781.1 hypothetical protein NAEX_08894 [Nannocystis exedens]SFF26041.1 hypothetical protein SAMN02745121_07798 [Nannocystis exedens]